MTRLFFISLMSFLLFLALMDPAIPAPTDPVNIPDANLRTVIEKKLGKSPGVTITEGEMNGMIETLHAKSKGIIDLTGLEHAINITEMRLSTNKITDITPLSNLTKLTRLELSSNKITDIALLSNLTTLETLHLTRNTSLSDISPLASLIKLEALWLGVTNITASGLSALLPSLPALKRLHITKTAISDLSVLQSLANELEQLKIDRMSSSPNIHYNDDGRLLTDISPLVGLRDAGKIAATAKIDMRRNFNLDYDSLYRVIPYLIDGGLIVFYSTDVERKFVPDESTPGPPGALGLERVSAERHVGKPGTSHTFVVRATNTTYDYFYHVYSTFPVTPYKKNSKFKGVPVTFIVKAPDGEQISFKELTGDDGLARVTITLGNHEEWHIVDAVVPENSRTDTRGHDGLSVRFAAGAYDTPTSAPTTVPRITVVFEDYPESQPTDEFTLTIKFSEPVTDFLKEDITLETELTSGTGTATLEALTPATGSAEIYTAKVGLPPGAAGTVELTVREATATSILGKPGPTVDTASELIAFGAKRKRRVYVFPSEVAMDKVVFNEIRNAEADTNDWIELKNISDEAVPLIDWEVSIVDAQGQYRDTDRDIVGFPDYELPPGGILLIVNTDPSETDLIRGQNLETPNRNPELLPQYLIRPEMRLPRNPYLLILRRARDKNDKPEAFEDLAGDYHKDDVNYRTQVWPLRDTWVYTGTEAQFASGEVWQRVDVKERGYTWHAWALSEYQAGLGYKPGASPQTSLGTPGYPTLMRTNETGTGHISFSEVMFATTNTGTPSQWIELYNNSASELVDLAGWELVIEALDSDTAYHYMWLKFKSLEVLPNQTVLLVSRDHRNSGNIPERRIYNVYRQNSEAFRRRGGAHRLLGLEGFALRLLAPDGTLVDMAGNLNGRQGRDKPRWTLPDGWTEAGARTSLIRVYENRVPGLGTVSSSWVRAADTALMHGYAYWGLPTDNGTPGYRQGSPLPVVLSNFRAELTEGAVLVRWTTESEIENAGFYVLRSRHRESGFVKVTPSLIVGAGTTAERQHYTYRDTTAAPKVPYYYRIEDVSLSGERRGLATVRLRGHLSGVGKLLWKWSDVKSED